MSKLSEEQIATHIRTLPRWKHREGRLEKTFTFHSFHEAIQFVNRVAVIAELFNHHPYIDIRHKQVTISLTTIELSGVTGRDFSVAKQIENLAG